MAFTCKCNCEATVSFLQCVDASSGDSDNEDDLCEYEKQQLRNIKENRALLASLNLIAAKEDLKAVTKLHPKIKEYDIYYPGKVIVQYSYEKQGEN